MTRAFPPSMLTRTLVLTTGLLLLGTDLADARSAAPPPTRQVSRAERREAIEGANRAMAAEDWDAAARAWARVEALDADFADASYNRGVAQYRAGDFRGAAESFQRAARLGDADLAARAMYNEGTARYAEALATLEEDASPVPADPSAAEMPPPDPQQDPLQDAIERVGRSLEHFRDAIDADPTSVDARANAELAHRLLRRLQEVQQQQQSQNGEGDQQQESEPQDGDGEQQQQSQPQDGEGEQQQQQSPPQDGEGEQQQQQSPPQDGEGEQQQQQQQSPPQDGQGEEQQQQQQQSPPQDGEGEEQQQQSPSASPGDTESKTSEAEATEGTGEASDESSERLSREAAERLLQSVRDKERQRRREKAREAAQGPRAPVERDW